MDHEEYARKKEPARKSNFFPPCPVTNKSPTSSSDNSNTDDLDKLIADTISRILKVDENEYGSRINELQKETQDWSMEYQKLKSEHSSETSTCRDVTLLTADDCVKDLTEQEKLFLSEKPDFGKICNNLNDLEKDVAILSQKKDLEAKKLRYNIKVASLKIDDLNHQVGKYFDNLADTTYNNIAASCNNHKGSCKDTDNSTIITSCSNGMNSPKEENLLEDNGL